VTLAHPTAPSDPAVRTPESGAGEPPRFSAYARGCGPHSAGVTDRILVLAERLLVPGLSRVSRPVTRPRSRI